MYKNRTHALIIGIDQYDSPGLSALQGARNDAVAWYRFCVKHLGVQPENITVLASPPLTARELGPEAERSRLAGGTRAEIVEHARQLADAASCDGGRNDAGFVTFSGHGLAVPPSRGSTEIDLALCPSDTRIDDVEGSEAPVVGNTLRFSELADIFRSQDSRDNITVFLDTCFSTGPAHEMRQPLDPAKAPAAPGATAEVDTLARARKILKVDAFTNRLLLGARHWTPAYEIFAGGQWRGAASFAMLTALERWALTREDGATYPNVSYGDLLDRVRSFLEVLGVPQVPAIWSQRRLDEMPFLRPGLKFAPGETSVVPDAPMNTRQIPVNPDKVGIFEFRNAFGTPIIRCIVTGASLPSGFSGYDTRTEYWYTNTTSPPALSSLTVVWSTTTSKRIVEDAIAGWTLSITCEQLIGTGNWSLWNSSVNTAGTLLKATDPTGVDGYMGVYLEYNANGQLASYAWYRMTLLTDGFAFNVNAPPGSFTAVTGTNPSAIATGTWRYSLVVPT